MNQLAGSSCLCSRSCSCTQVKSYASNNSSHTSPSLNERVLSWVSINHNSTHFKQSAPPSGPLTSSWMDYKAWKQLHSGCRSGPCLKSSILLQTRIFSGSKPTCSDLTCSSSGCQRATSSLLWPDYWKLWSCFIWTATIGASEEQFRF